MSSTARHRGPDHQGWRSNRHDQSQHEAVYCRVLLHNNSTPAQQQRFRQLHPGRVAAGFMELFSLSKSDVGFVDQHGDEFCVPLKSTDAIYAVQQWLEHNAKLVIHMCPLHVRLQHFQREQHGGTWWQASASHSRRDEHAQQVPGRAGFNAGGASVDVLQFWSRMQASVQGDRFDLNLHEPRKTQLWFDCWAAAAAGARGDRQVLLKVLLKTAAAQSLLPPPEQIVSVSLQLVHEIERGQFTPHYSISSLQLVSDSLSLRLVGRELEVQKKQLVLQQMEALLCVFTSTCQKLKEPGILAQLVNLITVVCGVARTFTAALQPAMKGGTGLGDDEVAVAWSTSQPWLAWREPTIGWLMSPAWLHAPALATAYDDAAAYCETLQRLTTMLTFYWGAGAISARCRHATAGHGSSDAQQCGEPLLATRARSATCTQRRDSGRVCGSPAVWFCPRGAHNDAACTKCMRRSQLQLMGSPDERGARCSTDIYDARVEGEVVRRDGHVYMLGGLRSRRPPNVPPNWRTTYRLNCAALVAVARLAHAGEALQPSLRIHWAEVVPVNTLPTANEAQARQNGRVAVRLFGSADLPGLDPAADLLAGTQVALVDLRVFVPEVVSVLRAYADPTLPEQLGRLPFVDCLIGKASAPSAFPGFAETSVRQQRVVNAISQTEIDPLRRCVANAISHSEIDTLRRLSLQGREQLISQISGLASRAALYGAQLEAFCEALRQPVHCTQGPPGTGKSYTGVQLVVALNLIRKAAIREGRSVGPIVLLAYKNHPLDEILNDVKNIVRLMPGELIRCGKPEAPGLMDYAERQSQEERMLSGALNERLESLRNARQIEMGLLDLSMHIDAHAATVTAGPEAGKRLAEWQHPSRALNGEQRGVVDLVLRTFAFVERLCQLREGQPTPADSQEASDSERSKRAFLTLRQLCRSGSGALALSEASLYELALVTAHWIDPSMNLGDTRSILHPASGRSAKLLLAWLFGAEPPPRCMAAQEDEADDVAVGELCMHNVSTPGEYCVQRHRCRYKHGCGQRRSRLLHLREEVEFCDQHLCKRRVDCDVVCVQQTVPNSQYCQDHSCPPCIYFNRTNPAIIIQMRAPHACAVHQCAIEGCLAMMLAPDVQLCEVHCCVMCIRRVPRPEVRPALPMMRLCGEHKCDVRGCQSPRLETSGGVQLRCKAHACTACLGVRQPVDLRCPTSRVCSNHRCQFMPYEILPRGADALCCRQRLDCASFCEAHACRVCVSYKAEAVLPADHPPPRNVCALHPLCSFVGANGEACAQLAKDDTRYCAEHLRLDREGRMRNVGPREQQCCQGVTRKGKPCKTKVTVTPGEPCYCADHMDQASETDADEDFYTVSSEGDASGEEDEQVGGSTSVEGAAPHGALEHAAFADVSFLRDIGEDRADRPNEPTQGRSSCEAEHARAQIAPAQGSRGQGVASTSSEAAASSSSPPTPGPTPTSTVETPRPPADPAESVDDPAVPTAEQPHSQEAIVEAKVSHAAESTVADDGVARDAVAGDVHPDELDYEEEEMEVESEEQQRLHEILGDEASFVDGNGSNEGDGAVEETRVRRPENERATAEEVLQSIRSLSWGTPVRVRWGELAVLLRQIAELVHELRGQSTAHLEQARRDCAEASAQAFKQADIVAATVVGAARRLPALRAAEPFAFVVEEACEVAEPTLMAVLSVRSLRKIELIGDHRQLPASIPHCWFNLEASYPSLKVSLFERLVAGGRDGAKRGNLGSRESDVAHAVAPYTVLDEQRRMRPVIADLTRGYYSDLVQIVDHPCTVSQHIGDRLFLEGKPNAKATHQLLTAESSICRMRPDLVPGACAQVFFWDLPKNEEGRPVAGLSACNYAEARAVAALINHLSLCGVPHACISVITPYKGQTRAILKVLRESGAMSRPRGKFEAGQWGGSLKGGVRNCANEEESSVFVSTVDRYQGDENDIVILSLVRTRPGNRFVALINRFIVATSRARIGNFIIGSAGAVSEGAGGKRGPEHWRTLLEGLREGNDGLESEDLVAKAECVPCEDAEEPKALRGAGRAFPICCPRHPETRRMVDCTCTEAACSAVHFPGSEHTWSQFCAERCRTTLRWCGHQCGLPCHAVSWKEHSARTQCDEAVQRPCEAHALVPLQCKALYAASRSAPSLAAALEPERFRCDVRVAHRRTDCPHSVQLRCYAYQQVLKKELELPACAEPVDDWHHPVCGHVRKSPWCSDRRLWERAPPKCEVRVSLRKRCGCEEKLPCHEVNAEGSKPCQMHVTVRRPRCGHPLSMRCFERNALLRRWEEHGSDPAILCDDGSGTAVLVAHDGEYGPSERELALSIAGIKTEVSECLAKVEYLPPCGHRIPNVPCSTAFGWAASAAANDTRPRCSLLVSVRSVFCGHELRAPCWVTTSAEWQALGSSLVDEHGTLPEGGLEERIAGLPPPLVKVLRTCRQRLTVMRRCTHTVSVQCDQLIVKGSAALPPCTESVPRRLEACGHDVMVACCSKESEQLPQCQTAVSDVFTFSCGKHTRVPGTCCKLEALRRLSPPCKDIVECSRYRCGHTLVIPCRVAQTAVAAQSGARLLMTGAAERPVVREGENYCASPECLPPCDVSVVFLALCGHEREDVPCDRAFRWAAEAEEMPPCKALVPMKSPLCGHTVQVSCCDVESVRKLDLWGDQEPWRSTITTAFDEDGDTIEYRFVSSDASRPDLSPLSDSKQGLLVCDGMCVVEKACGHHSRPVRCLEAPTLHAVDRCDEEVSLNCADCGEASTVPCHHAERIQNGEATHLCQLLRRKVCKVCGINEKLVHCWTHDVRCSTEVAGKLECGHEVSWTCGEEADPRSQSAFQACPQCLLPLWRTSLDVAQPPDAMKLRGLILSRLRKHADAITLLDEPTPFELSAGRHRDPTRELPKAQGKIAAVYCDLLRAKIANKETWDAPRVPDPPCLDDFNQYDIVFCKLNEEVEVQRCVGRHFSPTSTLYGEGVQLLPLEMESLKHLSPSPVDQSLTLCVGVAFRCAPLTDTAPFKPPSAREGSKVKRPGLDKKANKLAQQSVKRGFDYVLPCTDDPPENSLRVYWLPEAVVPLLIAKIKVHRTCGVCHESFVLSDGDGCLGHEFVCWSCQRECVICFSNFAMTGGLECDDASTQHFMCTDCLVEYVKMSSSIESIALFRERGGVRCSVPGCEQVFRDAALAKAVPEESFAAYSTAKRKITEQEITAEVHEQFQELQRRERLASERQKRKQHIVERILTLSCPRCGQAFLDFNGCMALTCARAACGCHFCAICQKDCGTDAHPHVRDCRYNTDRDLFSEAGRLAEMHRKVRTARLREYLKTLSPQELQDTLEDCAVELRDLRIRYDE